MNTNLRNKMKFPELFKLISMESIINSVVELMNEIDHYNVSKAFLNMVLLPIADENYLPNTYTQFSFGQSRLAIEGHLTRLLYDATSNFLMKRNLFNLAFDLDDFVKKTNLAKEKYNRYHKLNQKQLNNQDTTGNRTGTNKTENVATGTNKVENINSGTSTTENTTTGTSKVERVDTGDNLTTDLEAAGEEGTNIRDNKYIQGGTNLNLDTKTTTTETPELTTKSIQTPELKTTTTQTPDLTTTITETPNLTNTELGKGQTANHQTDLLKGNREVDTTDSDVKMKYLKQVLQLADESLSSINTYIALFVNSIAMPRQQQERDIFPWMLSFKPF